MKVLVIGLGTFGYSLCETLIKEGVEIIAVDNNSKNIKQIKNIVPIAIETDVKNDDYLDTIPLNEVDYAICCIGDNMQASLLATLYVKEKTNGKIIARAVSKQHAKILTAIGADEVVFLEEYVGERLAQRLVNVHVYNYIPLSDNHLIVEILVKEKLVGKKIGELRLRENFSINIVAIKQRIPILNEQSMENEFKEIVIDVPSPQYELKYSDILVIVGSNENIEKFEEEIKS